MADISVGHTVCVGWPILLALALEGAKFYLIKNR